MSTPYVSTLGIKTATGATDFTALAQQDNVAFQVTVASIGTSVTIRLEGSLDNTNYFNLNTSGDIVLSANGTTGYVVVQAPIAYVRCNLITITGGTPTVTFKVALSTAV